MKWLIALLAMISFSISMESQVNWTHEECERICKLLASPNVFSCAQLAKGSRRQTPITMPREFMIGNESKERILCVEALLKRSDISLDTSCLYQKNVPDVTFFAYLRHIMHIFYMMKELPKGLTLVRYMVF